MAVAALVSCSKGGGYDSMYLGGNIMAVADKEAFFEPESPSGDRFDKISENPFISASEQPVSTFSVDADGASYAYVRRCVLNGWKPSADAVRIEEFLNYFTFNYDDPLDGKDVALNAEVGQCPWNEAHELLRIGIKGKSLPASQVPLANFVFLIDISGSMSSEDKLPLLKTGLITMLDYMRPDDRIAIVTYASGEKLLLPSTPVSEKAKIVAALKDLTARGATAGSKAITMAYEEAQKNYIDGANNRIIMGTDGDFNVGVTSTDALVEMVESYADKGIYLTVCGFGMGNLNDAMMEKISNSGNGTYEYIDSELEMTKVFVNERSRFVTVANDCKAQVTFSPERVARYRLIGYENRVMSSEDFENDKKDAAEIGSGQTITALYEIEPVSDATGSLGSLSFRYKKSLGSESLPLSLELPDFSSSVSPEYNFAASLAAWGMYLRDSEYKGNASIELARSLAESSLAGEGAFDPYDMRKDFVSLLNAADKL